MSFHFRMVETPDSLPESYEPLVADFPDMLQFNNCGMFLVAALMGHSGVLDDDAEEPEFDEFWPPDGMDEERAEDVWDAMEFGDEPDPPLTEKERAILTEHEAMQEGLLATRSEKEGKVPAFKFGSNDGWIVVPEECLAIVQALGRFGDEELLPDTEEVQQIGRTEALATLRQWVSFQQVAADNGGYRVL